MTKRSRQGAKAGGLEGTHANPEMAMPCHDHTTPYHTIPYFLWALLLQYRLEGTHANPEIAMP